MEITIKRTVSIYLKVYGYGKIFFECEKILSLFYDIINCPERLCGGDIISRQCPASLRGNGKEAFTIKNGGL